MPGGGRASTPCALRAKVDGRDKASHDERWQGLATELDLFASVKKIPGAAPSLMACARN
jgi:hypothetical protein